MSAILLAERALAETPRSAGGTVYTDTVIFSATEAFAQDVPYQIAIVDLDAGGRLTVRIDGDNVVIGDRVEFLDFRDGIPFYRKPR